MPNPSNADILTAINEFRKEVRDIYVTKAEFMPVKSIAYALIGTVALAVLAAVLANVVKAL